MNENIHLLMNSFGKLFPDKIFSLTFPWHVSNSLTFPGFPDKWSPCSSSPSTRRRPSDNKMCGHPANNTQRCATGMITLNLPNDNLSHKLQPSMQTFTPIFVFFIYVFFLIKSAAHMGQTNEQNLWRIGQLHHKWLQGPPVILHCHSEWLNICINHIVNK